MPEQSAGILETIAYNQGINLQSASIDEILYIYALTFREIQRSLTGSLINFPLESLQEIVDVFEYTFNSFNTLLNQSLPQILYNDISIARAPLVQALSFASAAMTMRQAIPPNTIEYFQMLPIYQQHLLYCSIHVNDINNHVAGWLQRE
jgi:hypothetical protein